MIKRAMHVPVANLGEAPPFFILGKREEIKEGRKASRASKTEPHPHPPLGPDLPQSLCTYPLGDK